MLGVAVVTNEETRITGAMNPTDSHDSYGEELEHGQCN